MSKSDDYQRRAQECQRMADTAPANSDEKRSWLELVESWLRMMTIHRTVLEESPEAKFEAELQAKGTGHTTSDASN